MLVDEQVEVVGFEEKMTSSPRRREVSFDPPLKLNSYMPNAPFLSRLAIAKGSVDKEEVSSIQSSRDASPAGKSKKVWIEVPEKEKEKNDRHQEAAYLGNLLVKQVRPKYIFYTLFDRN